MDPVTDVERWFLRRGIPHFIHDYRASEDVFTRVLPLLTFVFLAEVVGASNLDWPWWANAAAVTGGLGLLVGIWALTNRLRRRPLLARPDDVGIWELAVFVLGPPTLPLVFGGQGTAAVVTAGANLAFLGLVYLAASYGIVPMTRWAGERLIRQFAHVWGVIVRALPMLLLFVTFLFINAEVWQVAVDLTAPPFAASVGLFTVIGVAFVASRVPRDLDDLAMDVDAAAPLVSDTPAARLVAELGERSTSAHVPLSGRERVNLSLLLLWAQGLQVLLVTLAIGVFFVVFGTISISEATVVSWTASEGLDVLVRQTIAGRDFVVSAELLRVAGFLAAFSGLYFAVYAGTDETFRREFRDEAVAELRQAMAVRAVYRAAVAAR